jgi:isopentenyl diphosphate isomerase/L-lactate dehydrogenase-like FMN-dependent dehydrogenase
MNFQPSVLAASRRHFLRFLAGSPLAAMAFGQGKETKPPKPATPNEVLNVLDMEELAREKVPVAHWGYQASGVDDDLTLKANRAGFQKVQLRPRRLVDVSNVDTKVSVFGSTWESPIFLCPVGGQKSFHALGEVGVAQAAKAKKMTQCLSTQSSVSIEDVAKALGQAPWFQLYMPPDWDATERMVRRVEATGCEVLAWTVDLLGGRNTETTERFKLMDSRDCTQCHADAKGSPRPRPMTTGIPAGAPRQATWAYVERLKKMTKMKVIIKGLETGEDARLARESGADGIVVSNHGGRATETYRGTIEALPEVVDAVGGRMPVLIDGGFRRGTDIYKALALGAHAVGVGRPYIWGLGAFGQEGVERVIDILRAELQLVMRQCGTPSISKITRASVLVDGKLL